MISAIQAGGRSSRMGADKAWLILDEAGGRGSPLIERVMDAAQPVVEQAAVVVSAGNPGLDEYRALAARRQAALLFDLHARRGPLGGIHTALAAHPQQPVLILACDLPFLTPDFLKFLRDIHEREANDVTVPVDAAGRTQMLVGLYSPACLEPVARMLDADELKVERLCARVRARRVTFAEYAHLPDAARLFVNINTPEEYRSARAQPQASQPPSG
jgi:molybdenum cofactor guanylyltransferase